MSRADVRNDEGFSGGYRALGAFPEDGATTFRAWSPKARILHVVLDDGEEHRMRPLGDGYHEARVSGVVAGMRYRIRLDNGEAFPDPASRFQPDGVHHSSMIVDASDYTWADASWEGVSRQDLVFYELHVGTFTPEGTFAAVRDRLPYLQDVGATAVELMPVADFPGRWNWGYDHAALYAPSRAYGSPEDLRRLVDDAHSLGIAVFLDVIYNHLGPDGAYVAAFAPMFTDKHETPWGMAINLDDAHSEGVRNLFIDNARMWLSEYHFDGLRLDATHALVDESEEHFLAELKRALKMLDGPERIIVAEDNRNVNTLIRPREHGGYGLDAVWTDDFHHQIRNFTAGDEEGYFADFADTTVDEIAHTVRSGWFYDGRRSKQSGKPRGTDASEIKPSQCVVCIQNHDQIGNRPTGARLNHEVSLAAYRAASALLLFAPELPLLFMGQEWAASSPFQFFTDHNPELGRQVTEGRKREFEQFSGFSGDVPDPQDEATFLRSKLSWTDLEEEKHNRMLKLYRDLLALRRRLDARAEVDAVGSAGIRATRGAFQLLVALGADQRMRLPDGARILFHTEDEAYAIDGRAPEVVGKDVYFKTPGALITSTDGS